MTKLIELRQAQTQRKKLLQEMRELKSRADARTSARFTPDEEKRWNELSSEVEKCAETISRCTEHLAEAYSPGSAARNHGGSPFTGSGLSGLDSGLDYRFKTPEKERRFNKLFCKPESPRVPGFDRSSSGFKSTGDFVRTILEGRSDARLAEYRASTYGSGDTGGYAIPTDMLAPIWELSMEKSIVRSRAKISTTSDLKAVLPAWSNSDSSAGKKFGFAASYLGELEEGSPQTAKMNAVTLELQKLVLFTGFSLEMALSSVDIEQDLNQILGEVLAYFTDNAFLNGSGVGQPLGVLQSDALVTVEREASNSVSYTDILNIYSKLIPGSEKAAIWVISQDVIPELSKIKDDAGHYLWSPGNKLMGCDVLVSERVPQLGNTSDIGLYDFSYYRILEHETGLLLDSTRSANWYKAQVDLIGLHLHDGQPLLAEPAKDLNGREVSAFVSLHADVAEAAAE